MKILRVVLYVLGILWILMYFVGLINTSRSSLPADGAERAGYYFGSALVLTPAIVFILLARLTLKNCKGKKSSNWLILYQVTNWAHPYD